LLPHASTVSARHDPSDTILAVNFPPASRYSLSLRGLDDPEIQPLELVARPTKPGLTADLTVFYEPIKPGGNKRKEHDSYELARFWIERDRLHFRWVAHKLERFQEQPAQALRECLLIIRGGGIRTQLALRGLVVQPEAITVKGGPVSVPWKQTDRPARRVNLLCCQVQRDGKWCDLDETGESNNREWIIVPSTEGGQPRLSLRLRLAADQTELTPSLEPSTRHIEKIIRDLTNRRGEHNDRVKGLRKLATGSGDELAEMKQALSEANAALHMAEANLEATRANVSQFYSPFMPVDGNFQVMIARNALEKARIARDTLAAEVRDYERKLPELSRTSGNASARLEEMSAAIKAEKALRGEAGRGSQLPIRVKLGIVIDGESIEVARIGPWGP
jgi:hypothetical protein